MSDPLPPGVLIADLISGRLYTHVLVGRRRLFLYLSTTADEKLFGKMLENGQWKEWYLDAELVSRLHVPTPADEMQLNKYPLTCPTCGR